MRGAEGAAEGENRGDADDGFGGADDADDGAHAHGEQELGHENHAAHDRHIRAQPPNLVAHHPFAHLVRRKLHKSDEKRIY